VLRKNAINKTEEAKTRNELMC